MIHIYTAVLQPATDYVDRCGEVEYHGGWPPGKLLFCSCCEKMRPAKNCVVQCYYDGMRIWCAAERGCKHPQAIFRKRWKEHMNRSLAQQARREREKYPNVKLTGPL